MAIGKTKLEYYYKQIKVHFVFLVFNLLCCMLMYTICRKICNLFLSRRTSFVNRSLFRDRYCKIIFTYRRLYQYMYKSQRHRFSWKTPHMSGLTQSRALVNSVELQLSKPQRNYKIASSSLVGLLPRKTPSGVSTRTRILTLEHTLQQFAAPSKLHRRSTATLRNRNLTAMDSDSHPHAPELDARTITTSDDGATSSSLDDQNVVVANGESRDANDNEVEGANLLNYVVLISHHLQIFGNLYNKVQLNVLLRKNELKMLNSWRWAKESASWGAITECCDAFVWILRWRRNLRGLFGWNGACFCGNQLVLD